MKTADRPGMSAPKLGQYACERRCPSHVKHVSRAQVCIRRDRAATGIMRKQHCAAVADHVLYQRQYSIKRETQVESVNRAVNVGHISRSEPKSFREDAGELRLS